MDDSGGPHLWGRERRYMLTELLWERGPMTVAEMAATLAEEGWQVGGRPSKTISDALRWEIAHGRVVRMQRGLYGPGRMPKQTKSWIRCRNRRTREEARDRLTGAQHRNGQTGTAGGLRPAHRTVASASSSQRRGPMTTAAATDVARPRARARASKRSTTAKKDDDDVVVLGGGWSEEDDAAEDEALRQRLLGSGPGGLSGGAT